MRAVSKTALLIAMPIAIIAGLSSCAQLSSLLGVGSAKLSVSNVTVATTNGVISGVTATIKNSGSKDASGLTYELVASSSSTIDTSANDPIIYKGTLSVAAGQQQSVNVTESDIATFSAANLAPTNAKYYIGIIADPTDATGGGPAGDETTSQDWVINGSLAAFELSGTLTAGPGLTTYNVSSSTNGTTAIPSNTYTLYVGLYDPNNSALANPSPGTNFAPSQIFIPGSWYSITVIYDSNVGFTTINGNAVTVPYAIGSPGPGPYSVATFIDYNSDGMLNLNTDPNNSNNIIPVDPAQNVSSLTFNSDLTQNMAF